MAALSAALLVRSVRMRCGLVLALPAAACCGAILHHHSYWRVPADHLVNYCTSEQQLARITGTVIDEPRTAQRGYAPFEPWQYQQARTSFVVAVDGVETQVGMTSAVGRVRVTVKDAALHVRSGARVEAFGWLYRPRGPANPGAFDWALFQRRRGVQVNLVCDRGECVRLLEFGGQAAPWWSRQQMRAHVRRMLLDERLARGGPGVSLLDAMILGRRSGMDREIEQAFIATGCAHYLAVSGMHVGMLVFVAWLGGRLLGWSRRRTAWVVMALAVLYAMVADPRPPILRATIMVVVLGLGYVTRRPRSLAGSICLAAMVVLGFDPPALFDLGFQLSFIAVIGIIALHAPLRAALECVWRVLRRWALRERPVSAEIERIAAQHSAGRWWRPVGGALASSLAVALAAWMSSLPIVAAGFGYLSPWGWLNSLLALPLVFIVMVTGFVRVACAALAPPTGVVLDPVLDLGVAALVRQLEALSALPGTRLAVLPPPWWLIVVYFGSLGVIAGWGRGWVSRRWVMLSTAFLGVSAAGWWLMSSDRPDGVRITQLAVGRGTSTVIELPDGNVWLYDAGASGAYDPGTGIIVPYLHHRGIRRLSGIILSHPNLDHFGGVPSVLSAVPCGPAFLPAQFESACDADGPCAALLEWLRASDHPIILLHPEEDLHLGAGVDSKVLWPPRDPPLGLEANDTSLVVRLRYGESAALFTGDIGHVPQQWLIEHGEPEADVLMLPHHGAVEANTRAFLEAVGARILVRSSFVPMSDSPALRALAGEAAVYNTADVGAVEVRLDSGGVRASGFRAVAVHAAEIED